MECERGKKARKGTLGGGEETRKEGREGGGGVYIASIGTDALELMLLE